MDAEYERFVEAVQDLAMRDLSKHIPDVTDAEMVVFRAGVLSGSLATLELMQARSKAWKHLLS